MMFRQALALLVVSAFTLSAVAPAHAAESADTSLTQQVRYDDLDLTKPAGVTALYNRLSGAARQVCREYTFSTQLQKKQMREQCISSAIANAVKAIDNSALTARVVANNLPRAARR